MKLTPERKEENIQFLINRTLKLYEKQQHIKETITILNDKIKDYQEEIDGITRTLNLVKGVK